MLYTLLLVRVVTFPIRVVTFLRKENDFQRRMGRMNDFRTVSLGK